MPTTINISLSVTTLAKVQGRRESQGEDNKDCRTTPCNVIMDCQSIKSIKVVLYSITDTVKAGIILGKRVMAIH